RDIYQTTSYAKNALVQPQSRAALKRVLDQGWLDAIRHLYPDVPAYTFWDYMRNRWQRDAGLRLDLLLLRPQAAKTLVDAGLARDVRGADGASDHAPGWVELRDAAKRPRAPARKAASTPTKSAPSSRTTKATKAPRERRPLLVIDGDSFAHRSY